MSMRTMQLQYDTWNGKNPEKYFQENMGAEFGIDMPSPSSKELEQYFNDVNKHKVLPPEPSRWQAATWQEHIQICLDQVRKEEQAVIAVQPFLSMDFDKVVRSMSGVVYGRPSDIDSVRFIERQLGVSLAEDYKEYLLQYSCLKVGNVDIIGLVGKDDIVSSMQEYHALFPHNKIGCYPICTVDKFVFLYRNGATKTHRL